MDSKKKNSKQKVGRESQENLEVLENVAENLMVGGNNFHYVPVPVNLERKVTRETPIKSEIVSSAHTVFLSSFSSCVLFRLRS